MCEIAVLPVDDADASDTERIQSIIDIASTFYDDNPHGLGIMVTKRTADDSFTNLYYKSGYTKYGIFRPGMREMLMDEIGDAWRITIHARYATAGAVDKKGTHPIITSDADGAEWDAVVHNGSVTGHKAKRNRLTDDGHSFATQVDSEIIAHVTDMPDDVASFEDESDDGWDEPTLSGSLNYILYSQDMILAYTRGKYHVTDDFTMACDHRDMNTDKPTPGERGWFLITPDGEVAFREDPPLSTTRSTTTAGNSNSRYGFRRHYFGSAPNLASVSNRGGDTETDSDDDGYTTGTTSETRRKNYGKGLRLNPHLHSDESFDYHAGYFLGHETNGDHVCMEHGVTFSFICPDCSREDVDTDKVGITFIPDEEETGTREGSGTGTIHTEAGHSFEVAYCPQTNDYYVEDECPECGVDHTEAEERLSYYNR